MLHRAAARVQPACVAVAPVSAPLSSSRKVPRTGQYEMLLRGPRVAAPVRPPLAIRAPAPAARAGGAFKARWNGSTGRGEGRSSKYACIFDQAAAMECLSNIPSLRQRRLSPHRAQCKDSAAVRVASSVTSCQSRCGCESHRASSRHKICRAGSAEAGTDDCAAVSRAPGPSALSTIAAGGVVAASTSEEAPWYLIHAVHM